MFSSPEKNIEHFALIQGMTLADIGAGPGFYAKLAARAVGPHGKIYAIDIQKEPLTRLANDAQKEHLRNIEIIWGDAEKVGGTRLRDACVDGVIVANLLFQIGNRDTFREEVSRILKPGGKVYVVDWTDSFGGLGPEPKAIVTASACKALFEAGFAVEKTFDAGKHHYGIIFKKK